MRSLCRSYECMNYVWVNIGFFTVFKKNKTAPYFLRSRLFTYDIMKNCNCN